MTRLARAWRRCWAGLRTISGDDAYERYLSHRRMAHSGEPALDRSQFYRAELDRRWSEPNRCC
jgi:uncharacterized short protein YbdD (DUF466 family)